MAEIKSLFATQLYRAELDAALIAPLKRACASIAKEDKAGIAWSKQNAYAGYTSYASLGDLPRRDPAFADLKRALDKHASAFAKALHYDLGGRRLSLSALWVNVLQPGGTHSGHIHPLSVLSGTYYVDVPAGSAALKLEDPRLPLMMAAPMVSEDAPEPARRFIAIAPQAGEALLWESWLRHEVPRNGAAKPRVSVSFNYGW